MSTKSERKSFVSLLLHRTAGNRPDKNRLDSARSSAPAARIANRC
jgi:hypothetical protein